MSDAVDRIRRSARLASDADIATFEAAIDDLPADLDPGLLRELLLSFDDEADVPEVMYDLVHRLEATPLGDEEAAFATVLPEMQARSPWWAQTVLMRLLNDPGSRAVLVKAMQHASSDSQGAFLSLLDDVAAGADAVAETARNVRPEFGPERERLDR